jgi:hypothetical protein
LGDTSSPDSEAESDEERRHVPCTHIHTDAHAPNTYGIMATVNSFAKGCGLHISQMGHFISGCTYKLLLIAFFHPVLVEQPATHEIRLTRPKQISRKEREYMLVVSDKAASLTSAGSYVGASTKCPFYCGRQLRLWQAAT